MPSRSSQQLGEDEQSDAGAQHKLQDRAAPLLQDGTDVGSGACTLQGVQEGLGILRHPKLSALPCQQALL